MEQVGRDVCGRLRGAMNLVSIPDVQAFAKRWADAAGHTVQHWGLWENEAAKFFGMESSDEAEAFHDVMVVVCAVACGTIGDVKRSLRDAGPSTLGLCRVLLGHLPSYAAPLEAEFRFRDRQLVSDWTMHVEKGQVVVRSQFKSPVSETEH
jgi:hypothetical protein